MLGDAPGHLAGAVEEDEARIVIAVRVEPVRDELACEVALSFFGRQPSPILVRIWRMRNGAR